MKIAIPITEEQVVSAHLALCDMFAIFHIENDEPRHRDFCVAPPHKPGSLPRWLIEKGVDVVIAVGIGQQAIDFLEKDRIEVIYGVESMDPDELIEQYIAGTLVSGSNICARIRP